MTRAVSGFSGLTIHRANERRRRVVRARDDMETALDALFGEATTGDDWDGPVDGDLWTPEEAAAES